MDHPADDDPSARQRVLLIDDDPMIHQLVRARLAGEPFALHLAATAADGIAMATAVRPDVILLDVELSLPGPIGDTAASGYDVCRRLLDDPAAAGVQVIFLSTHATASERTHGLDLGATDFVSKPFDAAELRARVRAGLRTKRLLDLLANRAQRDGLTGLWNRAYLDERLTAEMARATRYGTPLSLALLDVDRFKSINDGFGHPVGDLVLQRVAATLTATGRSEDVVCRYGGEEFAIIAPGTKLAGACVLAERVRAAIAAVPFPVPGGPPAVTASFGVAALETVVVDDPSPAALVAEADHALYLAKQAGRNRVACADPRPLSTAA